jgi:hypothetical protein
MYGPVPGIVSYFDRSTPALSDFAGKTNSGSMSVGTSGLTALKLSFTVWSSIAFHLTRLGIQKLSSPDFLYESSVASTSLDVNGEPSEKRTCLRKWKIHVFAFVCFHDVASPGAGPPFLPIVVNESKSAQSTVAP